MNIASSICPDDAILEHDTSDSGTYSHANHRSVKSICESMSTKPNTTGEFEFSPVGAMTMREHLRLMKAKKATGRDRLPAKMLKIGCDILCYPLSYLLNTCIKSGSFPKALKRADVSPILKKGDNMNVANYRPISILPSVSKLFEKEMTIQMSNYFEGIFSQYLSGFRKSHSYETVLIRMVENIKKALDAGKIVCAVLMDLSKAFDCLPHKLFLSKLKSYGMSPSACRLLSSYLKDR